jgi:hypothetical protein
MTSSRDEKTGRGSEARRPKHVVRIEQDEFGYWCATARCGLHGIAISEGTTFQIARRRIRTSIARLLDVPEDSFDIVDELARH